MLVLKRKEGDWTEVTHRSGDVIRLRVYGLQAGPGPARCNVAFDDDARNFEIRRPEREGPPDAAPFDPFAFRLDAEPCIDEEPRP
jgi:hypothetical protein